MKVAIITCSPQNDYPRARSLRTAVAACPGVETLIIRNSHKSRLRYLEVMLKICKARLADRPDAYLLTFRGYEMFLFMALTFARKPIIFDELINFTEWMEEQGRLKAGSVPYRLFRRWYAWLAGHARIILADTSAHAQYSATLNMLSVKRYTTVPVGTDEEIFFPVASQPSEKKQFTVLYYGHMLALHGLSHVLEAAVLLKDRVNINFRLIGGKKKGRVAKACAEAERAGAHVTHENWLPLEDLPGAIHEAGLVLGGPFGDTLQSQFVITGKTYQALASAAPVLIGKNQVNEDFTDKSNCLMVSQADAKALVEAIGWAADHPEEMARIGLAGRKLYETRFSQDIVNKLIAEMVAQL
jgi:glycosyltransferase involved in cell wall biosynthesis